MRGIGHYCRVRFRTPAVRWILGVTAGIVAVAVAATAVAAETSKLTYFTWAGYNDPAFRKPYTDKYGAGPRYTFYSGTDEGFTRLAAGFQADVAHPCIHDVKKWKDAGLLQPIDTSKITAWNDLLPGLRDSDAIRMDGKQWLVPWEWGFSSLMYRADKVRPTEQTFALLIDPKYRGRTAFPDVFDELFQVAAVLAGVRTPLSLQESDYPKVEQMFRALRDNARFMWTDPAQLEQAMASGEIDVAWGWPNTVRHLRQQGVPVDYMLRPKEKLVTWLCGLAHLKSSTAPRQEVYDFINALTAPASGKALVEDFGYGSANSEALKIVPKADLDALGLGGDANELLAHGNLLGPMPEAQRKRLIDMWETIKAGG
jgi:putative spermidine/putrescine transport system substrate-binding protein/spermidine/putrescine transport system substrate-binding protein